MHLGGGKWALTAGGRETLSGDGSGSKTRAALSSRRRPLPARNIPGRERNFAQTGSIFASDCAAGHDSAQIPHGPDSGRPCGDPFHRLQLVNQALIELSDSMPYSRPPQGLGFAVAWSRCCDDGKVPNVDSVRVADFTGGLTETAREAESDFMRVIQPTYVSL
jgi:hypothetical protein